MQIETIVIHEIYASIQGESSFVGWPCTFIRTTACNLRCRWCDTPNAFTGGERMTIDAILEKALTLKTPLIEVTGGEPLLQLGTLKLLQVLCDTGKTILLETSGERDISQVDERVHRIVDLKAPGSGEHQKNRWNNINYLTKNDEIKIVLADRADYEWALNQISDHDLASRVRCVLLSPVWGELDPKLLIQWMLEDRVEARFQTQLHKTIWGSEALGV